jgi:ABC-type nitrate/sulfonate/bicarbonate transport system ATPase subunit
LLADVSKPFPRNRLGFVFQEGHLITDASAGINAALPGLLNGFAASDLDLVEYMDALRLPDHAASREAWRLSGGQKQRVALLRALFHRPQVIFADEPTSSLDKRTAEAIMQLIVDYQEQEPGRTLFWATHDLQLAADFATDFVIVRKSEEAGVELEGPLPNPGRERFSEIENRVYEGTTVTLGSRASDRMGPVSWAGAEVSYTQAKLGGSLTFARRDSPQSLFEIGRIGRWMASIEGGSPPLLRGFADLFTLYRRFSDYAVAGGVMMSMLMLSFVFLGLTTMEFFRAQGMSEPASCNVVASAPDAGTAGSVGTELTQSLLTNFNDDAPWRSSVARPASQNQLLSWKDYFPRSAKSLNPCGEARDLVFGRSTTFLPLHIERGGECVPISATPKTLVANLAEPAILGTTVRWRSGEPPQQLAKLIPQGQQEIDLLHPPSLTGEELFVTEALREQLKLDPAITELPANLADIPLCVPGVESQRLHIGGVVSGLPQPRGLPYLLLAGHGSPWLTPSDSYEQAVFYTHPERADRLRKYLVEQRFAFARDEIERMISASARFAAIYQLIWLIGGIVVLATFLFLYTCIRAFLEKNARSNAVLRAYGLTKQTYAADLLATGRCVAVCTWYAVSRWCRAGVCLLFRLLRYRIAATLILQHSDDRPCGVRDYGNRRFFRSSSCRVIVVEQAREYCSGTELTRLGWRKPFDRRTVCSLA